MVFGREIGMRLVCKPGKGNYRVPLGPGPAPFLDSTQPAASPIECSFRMCCKLENVGEREPSWPAAMRKAHATAARSSHVGQYMILLDTGCVSSSG